jgi:hypothetical protein
LLCYESSCSYAARSASTGDNGGWRGTVARLLFCDANTTSRKLILNVCSVVLLVPDIVAHKTFVPQLEELSLCLIKHHAMKVYGGLEV